VPNKEVQEFSAIVFIRSLEAAVARIDSYPLTSSNFVIQQDEFKRLGALDISDLDNPEEAFTIFAVLDCSRKERDTDMRFAVEFSAVGVIVSLEGSGSLFFEYAENFTNEQQAVKQIVALLKMLSNGQLATHLTFRNGQHCASELLLYNKQSRIPLVLSTEGSYKRVWRKGDETGYEALTLRNTYSQGNITVPENFFIIERKKNGEQKKKGRVFQSAEPTPLTKKMYTAVLEEIGGELMGQKPGESEERALIRHWEFWAVGILTAAILLSLAGLGILPHFIIDHPFVVTIVSMFVAGGLGSYLVMRKIEKQETEGYTKSPLTVFLGQYWYEFAAGFLVLALLVSTFLPIFVLFDSPEAVHYWSIVLSMPVAALAPFLFICALAAIAVRSRLGPKLFAAAVILGIITLFVVNGIATNMYVETPEPYTSLAIFLYLGAPFVAPLLAYSKLKKSKRLTSKRAKKT